MSDNARPEQRALRELETLVRHLGEELASFRRRALQAEGRLKDVEGKPGGAVNLHLSDRATKLEAENKVLREKVEAANLRARQLLDRVRFLRQQTQAGMSEK